MAARKIKRIIDDAIEEEEYFYNLYMSAAEKTGVESVKSTLTRLAGEERKHKERLESLDPRGLGFNASGEEADKIAGELMLTPLDEFESLTALFKFAVSAETRAQEKYFRMANSVDDEKAKKLYKTLSAEEAKHKLLLEEVMGKLGLS